jgi:cytochrome c
MDDKFNTIAGWALGSAIVAFGFSSVSGHYFRADKPHRPHEMGYEIEGVVSSEGGEAEKPIEAFLATADLAKGEAAFKKCTSCHTITPGGANGIGPNLHGVVGEAIAAGRGGFAFSAALKEHGGSWDWKNLSDWLHNPKKFAPGTKMTFAGLSNPEERANLIAWMNTQGSNLPLPAAPAEAAAPAGEPGTGDTAGVSADPAAGAGPATSAGPEAAGAVAQPAPKVDGGGDKAVGGVSTTPVN